ncbi:uroporphyrin-3 C-methyltransferase [Luteibacter sp. Sphag1AF]|uniref:uroporphyrinogen-III C-methyltransferase n=1 Tax=Luteibacter sp. Sphag1AF TaxID=2587031 RepID=UPI00160D00A4|nr:uroporphyrinogen-III C-methyltransferase [Luteibacter sp. Sphag1AF]MBB3226142.1 uroporphyrin-3 C-methyltransferase [Luteibacter sp. Sphag1AF]
MTTDSPQTDSVPATPAHDAAPRAAAPEPRRPAPAARHGGGTLAVAVLFALVALGAAGYAGYRVWQLEQRDGENARTVDTLKAQVATLSASVSTMGDERNVLRQRMGDSDAVNRSLREEVLGVSERTRNLEDAVANLSEQSLSGHDAMLLDEAESLLRMAKERFALFGDASGALSAYELADKTLAAVNDAAFSGVRQSLGAERAALAAVQPIARGHDLDTLAALRAQLPSLPLKPLDSPQNDAAATGFWQRAKQALSSVVSVRRDDSTPLAAADGRIARELAMLDIAHAEAAILAYDDVARDASLKRVAATLASQFDTSMPAVREAQASITALVRSSAKGAAPKLGSALDELRNLRSVHALKPVKGGTAAPASSASAPAPAHAASIAADAARGTP